jgi:hypothetical protein
MTDEKERRFDLNELKDNPSEYDKLASGIKSGILSDFQSRHDKAIVSVGGDDVEMSKGKLLINLMLLRFYEGRKEDITKSDLYLYDYVTADTIDEFFDMMLTKCGDSGGDYDSYRDMVANSLNEMSDLSGFVNVKMGDSISFYDFVRMASEDKDAVKIFTAKVPYGLKFDEVEAMFSKVGKEIVELYKNRPDSDLYPFIRTDTGLNIKQLTQAISFVGLKPDITGGIIPVCINDNYLYGFDGIEPYYINCLGTRKATVTNFRMVRKSGYLTRKLLLATIDRTHDDSVVDCGTKHYITYSIENEKKLKQIDGRNYYMFDEIGNPIRSELKTISASKDKGLIGKKIALRSPVTCCGKNVCATCYGRDLSSKNKNYNTGLVAAFKLTEPLTQKLLSAKHLLATKSDKINWGQAFNDAFVVNLNSICFKDGIEASVQFKAPGPDDYDDDVEMYGINEMDIFMNGSRKPIHYVSPETLYVNDAMLAGVSSSDNGEREIKISSDDCDEDGYDFVFKYAAKNNELTKSLQNVEDLIESAGHLGVKTYDELVNKFDDLLIENDLPVKSVHAEMIASVLIKDSVTGRRPDFKRDVIPAYDICRVSKAVMTAPISRSLAFERINDQLANLATYDKNDQSIMDWLYK